MDPSLWIDVTSESFNYSLKHFLIPRHYNKDLENILIPHGLILDRIAKLAQLIVDDFPLDSVTGLHVLCVLKGGHQFFADLVHQMKKLNTRLERSVPLSLDFVKIKSYHNMESSGEIKVSLGEEELKDLKGKHILIVEDIIGISLLPLLSLYTLTSPTNRGLDTGKTITKLLNLLKKTNPASIKVASLLLKKTPLACGYIPDYVGFAIPDEFVVGYALDYNEHFRDLDHICVISVHFSSLKHTYQTKL